MGGSRLVYSTDGGAVRPARQEKPGRAPKGKAQTGPAIPQAPDDGWVRLWRVKGGRGGKTTTVITGLPGSATELDALAVELRRLVGAGGSVRQGAIEIQGDHRERLRQRLTELGHRVKLAGG
ncbi:MAG: translation initiation factor [Chloroflexota bacterium]